MQPKKFNEVEIREHNQFKISNWFAALENFDDSEAIYRSSNNIRTPKSQLKKIYFIVNGSSLHCSGCMIQAIIMQIIHTLQDMKLADIAETNCGNFGQVKLMNLKQTV
jgi:hypothetical protein